LEGIKADTDGERDLQKRNFRLCDTIDIGDKEISIFKESERQQTCDYRGNKKNLAPLCISESVDQKSVNIAGNCCAEHQKRVDRFSVKIEEQAGKQQDEILEFKRNCKVKDQYNRQKIIQKTDT
jgi:hypothetical protein